MKKYVLLFLTIIPLVAIGQANKLIRQGLKAEDSIEKIELFTQAIELDPKNLDAYFHRALAKNDIGDFHGAILDYTKVIFYEPDADSYYNRGNSKFNLQDFEGASEDYEQAIAIDPELWDAVYNLGLVKSYLGDYKAAISNFDKILIAFPYDTRSYRQRAMAHMELENHKEAFFDFARNIIINEDSSAYYDRGYALLSLNYYKEALSDLYKAIRLDRNNTPCYFYIGVARLFLDEYIAAITGFNESVKFDNQDFEAHLGLAIAYYKTNELEKAKSSFIKAKEIINKNGMDTDSMEEFNNTYWYKNHNQFFTEIFKELNAL